MCLGQLVPIIRVIQLFKFGVRQAVLQDAVGTLRIDIEGTATNATQISGAALVTTTNVAAAVVDPLRAGAALGATSVQPAALSAAMLAR